MQTSVGGWFGAATPTPTPTPQTKAAPATAPRVYYAGAELKVYGEPSTSSKVVGQLSLYEKVTRSKLERGFAYVESAASGTKGWVINAQLIWRLPGASTTAAPAAAEPQPEEPAGPAVEEPQGAETPAPAEELAPTPTATPVSAARSTPKATPAGVAPSIFNPY